MRSFLAHPSVDARAGCTSAQLDRAQLAMNVRVPEALRALLSETDGWYDTAAQYEPQWRLRDLVERNRAAWQEGFPAELLAPDIDAFWSGWMSGVITC